METLKRYMFFSHNASSWFVQISFRASLCFIVSQTVLLWGLAGTAAGLPPLKMGSLSATSTDRQINVSLSAPLSGGSGVGYSYRIYRDTQPHFTPCKASLLATATNLGDISFVDQHGLIPRTMYYYKVIGFDLDAHATNAIPAGLGNPNNQQALSVSASLKDPHLNIVYIGDSISEAGKLPDRARQSPPAVCSECLRSLMGVRDVYMSNQGHGGATTVDFLPKTQIYFGGVENAARKLNAAHPGLLVFSIMLGANDSANSTTRGAPVAADTYYNNLKVIIDRLLADFSGCRIIVHQPTWYSPNTHNSANYEETGLERLTTYLKKIPEIVHAYDQTHPQQVFEGDQTGYRYFAANYLTSLFPQKGRNGTFYLHPNVEGSAKLGALWAESIAFRLYPPDK